MKYSLYINQRAIIETGLPLDVIDALIFYALHEFINNPKFKKVAANGKQYTFVSWTKIVEHLPILGISTKQNIVKRVNKLIALQLIERVIFHNESYYATGANARLLFDESNANVTPSVTQTLQKSNANVTPSVTQTLHNNTIKDKNINKRVSNDKNTHTGVNHEILEYYQTDTGTQQIRAFAKAKLLTLLPDAVFKQTGKTYSTEQIEYYISATLAGIANIDLTKCEFSETGELIQTDLTQHVINKALKQCRDNGGISLPTMPKSQRDNYQSPFK